MRLPRGEPSLLCRLGVESVEEKFCSISERSGVLHPSLAGAVPFDAQFSMEDGKFGNVEHSGREHDFALPDLSSCCVEEEDTLKPEMNELFELEAEFLPPGEKQESCAKRYVWPWNEAGAELSKAAEELGKSVFLPIAKLQALPGKNFGPRLLIKRKDVLGFFGVGDIDLSRLLHVLLIPREAGMTSGDGVRLRWIFDLVFSDIPLLESMKAAGLDFLRANYAWLMARSARFDREKDLLKEPLEHWLEPKNVQFGFHVRPSVGYLHMHMLVGPITKEGCSDRYKLNWISLDEVFSALRTRGHLEFMLEDNRASAVLHRAPEL